MSQPGGCYWHLVGRGQRCWSTSSSAKDSTPTKKNYLAPNVNSLEVEKLWSSFVLAYTRRGKLTFTEFTPGQVVLQRLWYSSPELTHLSQQSSGAGSVLTPVQACLEWMRQAGRSQPTEQRRGLRLVYWGKIRAVQRECRARAVPPGCVHMHRTQKGQSGFALHGCW